MAERIRQEFTAAREVAERTEGNPELYRKGMAGIFQAYGIAGGGVLVVMALPAMRCAVAREAGWSCWRSGARSSVTPPRGGSSRRSTRCGGGGWIRRP
ncbi:MAG: hypothetical protein IPO52_03405 [Gemmatimonadetes bacterium]|nr:hypothetical protein [Gemmatimonadota bacterium]